MKHCCPRPGHNAAILDGGPVLYTCPHGHGVYAADIPTERPAGVTR